MGKSIESNLSKRKINLSGFFSGLERNKSIFCSFPLKIKNREQKSTENEKKS